jgi:hypothetical protein
MPPSVCTPFRGARHARAGRGSLFNVGRNAMLRNTLFLIIACFALSACGDTIKGKSIAEPEVSRFHERLNGKRFEEIYSSASDDFRNAAPKERVLELFSAIDRKLGPAKSFSTTNWNVRTFNFVTTVVLVESTSFDRGTGTETFTFRVSGDKAVLVGYSINSLDMLTK